MSRLCVRLRDEERIQLEKIAEAQRKNVTEVIRDLIRLGYERQTFAELTQEIKDALTAMTGRIPNADIAEIKRIVTLIGRAMPGVARHLS